MKSDFRITAISENGYTYLFELNKEQLCVMGALLIRVDENPGYPCRVSLQDVEVGEEVILFPYEHHKTVSPYRAKGPVYIRKNAKEASLKVNEIPKMLEHRLLSLRVYNAQGMMIDARTMEGKELRVAITSIFQNKKAAYIQVHNASPGCYNCQINRTIYRPT